MTNYTLNVTTAAYTWTRNAAGLARGARVNVTTRGYAVITFSTSKLSYGSINSNPTFEKPAFQNPAFQVDGKYGVAVHTQTYAVTANDVGLRGGFKLPVAVAAYVGTANPAVVAAQRRLGVGNSAYILTAPDVAMWPTPLPTLRYVVTASEVTLRVARRLPVAPAHFDVSGFDVRAYLSVFNYPDVETAYVTADKNAATLEPENRAVLVPPKLANPSYGTEERFLTARNRNR